MDATVFRMMMGAGAGPIPGQQAFTIVGTFKFIVPPATYFMSWVLVAGGDRGKSPISGEGTAGGKGGNLRYINDLPVTPGEELTVVVPNTGEPAVLKRGSVVLLTTTTPIGNGPYGGIVGGGDGGDGGGAPTPNGWAGGGGGGAGGYSGKGGNGGTYVNGNAGNGQSGNGGSGAGGGTGSGTPSFAVRGGGPGGGVGLSGEGPSGVANSGGGSGGISGTIPSGVYGGGGGRYGGGGGGAGKEGGEGLGAQGAARSIWGYGRTFPSTRTADE